MSKKSVEIIQGNQNPRDADFWDPTGAPSHPFWLERSLKMEDDQAKARVTEDSDTTTPTPDPEN